MWNTLLFPSWARELCAIFAAAVCCLAATANAQETNHRNLRDAAKQLDMLFGKARDGARFDTWFWERHGRGYRPFLPIADGLTATTMETTKVHSDVAATSASALNGDVSALLKRSAENFTTSSLPRSLDTLKLPSAAIQTDSTEIKLYDPITNLLLRLGAEEPLDAQQHANLQQSLSQYFDNVTPDSAARSISDFLSTGFDIGFGDKAEDPRQNTLRLQLLANLSRFAGKKAVDTYVSELRKTNKVDEVIALAALLDRYARAHYASDILRAAGDLLAGSDHVLDKRSETALQAIVSAQQAALASRRVQTAANAPQTSQKPKQPQSKPNQETEALDEIDVDSRTTAKDVDALITASRGEGETDLRFRAMQLLGRFSSENSHARTELLRQARANAIPEDFWPDIAIAITRLDMDETSDSADYDARIEVIADLLEATDARAAIDALEEAATLLEEEQEEEDLEASNDNY